MYKEYIMNKPELLKLISDELNGKRSGCWCKPLTCHGDVLAELADSGIELPILVPFNPTRFISIA